jgi:hypothetical protein
MSARAFAEALAAIDPEDPALRAAVALQVADALACLAHGRQTREGRGLLALYDFDADPRPDTAAAATAAIIRMTEWDAIHLPSCVSAPAIAVPVALMFAMDPDDVAAAVEAGCAVGVALATTIGGPAALARGIWPAAVAAPAIAATAAGIAMGLDDRTVVRGIALSLAGVSGRIGRPGVGIGGQPSGRWFAIGEATLKGIRAARAAEARVGADIGLLDGEAVAALGDPAVARPGALRDLPTGAAAATGLKPYVAARQGTNAIAAILDLVRTGALDGIPDAIRVWLPPVAVPVVTRPLDPHERLSRIANLGLRLATALREPEGLYGVAQDDDVDPAAMDIAGRVTVEADPALDDGTSGSWPARVAVRTGTRWIEGACARVTGDAGDAAGREMAFDAKLVRLPPDISDRLRSLRAALATGDAAAIEDGRALLMDHTPR